MGMRQRDDDYKYLPIIDARIAINEKVNLMGVVIEINIPKKTKGTDYFCRLKIVDESHPCPGIFVNFFAGKMENFPQVMSIGDIIQLSQVVMKIYNSEVYALFNKKFSAFSLFEGKHGINFVPYQFSSSSCLREQDKKFIASLRKWVVNLQLDTGDSTLAEIREDKYLNLFCKVLHACEVQKDEWMIFVWDGTDTPPCSIQTDVGVVNLRLEDELQDPIPLHLESVDLPTSVLCTFPHVGTVLRVFDAQGTEKLGLHLVKTGKWVKVVNIKFKVHKGLWLGAPLPFTKLWYLSDDNHVVLQRQRSYKERMMSKLSLHTLTCFPCHSQITEVDCPDAPFVTLLNALTYPEVYIPFSDRFLSISETIIMQRLSSDKELKRLLLPRALQVTAKFRCAVRVVAACPWRVKDFHSADGICRIRLTLEDPTARIRAYVYGEHGEKLFKGHPSDDVLIKKRNLLLGIAGSGDGNDEIEDVPRNPPRVDVCLKSYYFRKEDIWRSRRFQIIGTKLVG